jgi:hypothetical protein
MERIRRQKPTGILTGKTLLAAVPKVPNFFPRFSIYIYRRKKLPVFAHFPNRQKSRQKSPVSLTLFARRRRPEGRAFTPARRLSDRPEARNGTRSAERAVLAGTPRRFKIGFVP